MTDQAAKAVDLSKEQLEIVDLPSAAKVLVFAGAGTGKTHVLALRLAKLVEVDKLQPGSEILVLSFSRAAVSEIHRRLGSVGGDAGYASVMTFDSFATYLLASVDPGGDWEKGDYDERIEQAITRIEGDQHTGEILRQYRHLLIDELQDVVGVRARLVLALLRRCECGFTLLGDPAQSIYEYQAGSGRNACKSSQLFAAIRERFKSHLRELSLASNFRAQSDEARRAAAFGGELRARNGDAATIRSGIDTFILSQQSVGDLRVVVDALRSQGEEKSAVLCRSNAQALVVSRALWELGVHHLLQPEAIEKVAAPWLALLLDEWMSPRITRSKLMGRSSVFTGGAVPSFGEMWGLLKRLDPGRGDELDLRKVAARLRAGAMSEELYYLPEAKVVVSTIHRAKGLEFSRVIVAEPKAHEEYGECSTEETRLLYVAITRARREICIMLPPDTRGLVRCESAGNRWIRREFGKRRSITAIEIRSGDSDSQYPPGHPVSQGKELLDVQRYIRHSVKPGDSLELRLSHQEERSQTLPIYEIRHGARVVGRTSEGFGRHLVAATGRNEPQDGWPTAIAAVRAQCTDSTAGTYWDPDTSGLGVAGIWSRVRLSGLGELEYGRERR